MSDTLYREATNHEIIERTDVIYLAVLPVEIDYEAAADAFNTEMLRITKGVASSVEMRAIHAALNAGIGGDDER